MPIATHHEDDPLFTPTTMGAFNLKHRVVLAPMSRMRGVESTVNPGTYIPGDLIIEHYRQRTTDGAMIISEALPVSPHAGFSKCATAIYNEEQIEAWSKVVDAVHAEGGIFIAQLWHQGRNRKVETINGIPVQSSSNVRLERPPKGPAGFTPVPMTQEDIDNTINDYVQSAKNAIRAGFDGVEIHGANGYLPDQFLHSNINTRTDKYGGSIENRNRFVIDLSLAVANAIGPERFGLRLAPYGFFNECNGSDRVEQWTKLCRDLAPKGFAYFHFMEPRYDEFNSGDAKLKAMADVVGKFEDISLDPFREALGGVGGVPVIVAGGYDGDNSWDVIPQGKADAIGYGRFFTSNPDMVYRLKYNIPLIKYIRPRFYGPFPDQEEHYNTFPYCEENSDTPERKALLEKSKLLGYEFAKSGWQLSSDGIQMGGMTAPVVTLKPVAYEG